jgi:hypothetical protein
MPLEASTFLPVATINHVEPLKAARNLSAIWERQYSHNYEITAFEAYMDMYVAVVLLLVTAHALEGCDDEARAC